jgi:PAS domain S-box-containing protein
LDETPPPANAMKKFSIKTKMNALTGLCLLVALAITLLLLWWMQVNLRRDQEVLSAYTRQINLARVQQVDFKKQVQEWKDILLRGQEAADFEKYHGLFLSQETIVQENGKTLAGLLAQPSIRAKEAEFLTAHEELGRRYRSALAVFVQSGRLDYKSADRLVRGLDRGPTDLLDEVVGSLENDFEHYKTFQAAGLLKKQEVLILMILILFAALMATSLLTARSIITERKRAEAVLRESEARYRALFDGSADGIVIADSETKLFRYANPALCRMLGYTEAELTTLGVTDIHPPESLPQVVAEFEAQARGEKTLAADLPCRRKDGSVFPADISAVKITIDGRPCNAGFFRDITKRKQADETLRMFQFASDQAADAVFWLDQNGGFYYVNDEACRSLGYTREELMRLSLFDIDPLFPRENWAADWRRFRDQEIETIRMESRHRRKDGSVFPIEVMVKCLRFSGTDLHLAFARDMTERKQMEAVRQAGENRLRELNVLQGLLLHPNSLEQKLKFITEAVVQIMGADFARIWMIAPGDRCAAGCIHAQVTEGPHVCRFRDRCLHLLASSGRYTHTDGGHGRVPFGCYKIGQLAAGEETKFLTNDATNEPRVHDHAWAKELGLVAFAGYRLRDSSGHPLGVLALFSKQPVSAEEDLFLEGIAYATSQVLRAALTEAALTYERDLLRTLLDQSPDDIYFKDAQSRFIKASKTHARQFKATSPEAMVGKTDFDFFTDAHARPAFEDEQEIIRTGVPIIGKVEKEVWQDGREDTWVLTTKMPFHDKDGKIIGTFGISKDITSLKQIEHALTHERDLLRTLLDQSPDKIYFKDTQSRFIKAGKAHACMFKVTSPEELVGKTDFDFFSEEHARPAFEDEQEIIRTGNPIIGKVEKEVWQDGRGDTWVLTTKMPFRDQEGKIIGTFGISKDITSLKQIEHALAYERDLFKMMMDQSPDAIYFKDLQSRFVRFSQSKVKRSFAAELARHAAAHPDENLPAHLASEEQFAKYLVGKTDFDLFTEAHARPAFEDEQEIIRTGVPLVGKVEKEVWLDGQETWVFTSKMPFRNNDGQIVGTFGVSKDITAMKLAEERLRQLSQAVEQSPACVVVTDPAGNITYVNPKFTAITGYTFAEVLGKNSRILKSGETSAAAYTELWQTITAGQEWHGEFHNKKKNGELYWEAASISPIFDAAGKITSFLAVKEDITAHKSMEEKLFQAQKLETVGKLAGGIAHEFNSILTAIIGQSELLIADLPAGDPLAKNATEIRSAADRAASLTRQLLAYGRKQFLQPEALDLNRVLASMDGMLRQLMGGETVAVNLLPAAGLHLVKADAGQIEQVITNLAFNARDAMPNGGRLTLETANVTFDAESVGRDHPELKPGNYALLAITDTGTGMRPEIKARVFEPFFTTKGVGQGTGLGLSTCYGIIKQSGGHISVYSEPGRGTTFKIYLPQIPAENQPPPPKSAALPGGTETILLVEDDASLCELAATLLRRLGYTVLTAANGVEALSLKQQRATGHIDLLFTDVVMPHMSGKELADRVQALFPHTKILFTSAYTENASLRQGVLDKGVAFLQKPFTPTALAHKVRAVLDAPPG